MAETPAVFNTRGLGATTGEQGLLQDLHFSQEVAESWAQFVSGKQVSDTNLTALSQQARNVQTSELKVGRIIQAWPYIHCYKVQLAGREASCIASALMHCSSSPLGVKSGEVLAPNTPVLVWRPATAGLAYILAVFPQPTVTDAFNASDFIQQGGNSGVKKVEAYRHVHKTATASDGLVSQSCGRPMDGLIGEYVRMSETGIGLLIDSFQAYLRVNEACGLWLNYFDSHTKLSGLSLQLQSYAQQVLQQYDEGEILDVTGYSTFPWEAAGLYDKNSKATEANSTEQVQLDKDFPFATEDLKHTDTTPVHRLVDTAGYLGQGFNRTLLRPAKLEGVRRLADADSDHDIGLFHEQLTLDGAYGIRSAKEITFAKYPVIPVPRVRKKPEDAQGDDLTRDNNYRFSGTYGQGDPHVVEDWNDDNTTLLPNMLRPAGLLDMFARHFNWKGTHPYHYKEKDYAYPEESEMASPLNEVKFYRGRMAKSFVNLTPKKLNIDTRYKEATYYNTASFFTLTEDGSVVIADGYGSQIVMSGGQIRFEAGGDVLLQSGSRVVTLAKEAIIRTDGSIDISSNTKDVRIKAEKNLQLLGGNSGQGAVLIESKGKGLQQNYAQQVGEDVQGSGITLLTRGGGLNLVSKTGYIRTGVDEGNAESTGDLVIDCANGKSRFVSYAKGHALFNTDGLGIWHSPSGQDDVDIDASNYLGPKFSKITGPTVMSKDVCITDGGRLAVDGAVYAKGSIFALGQMACYKGVVGDSSTNKIPDQISKFIEQYVTFAQEITDQGTTLFTPYYVDLYWSSQYPGNTQLLNNDIGFSFRDKSNTGQAYGYADDQFFIMETRWQQLERTGLVTEEQGSLWKENPVTYQGRTLYPWPGQINWVDRAALVQYGSFALFETAQAKNRDDNQAAYETPTFPEWQRQSCDNNYSL